MKKKYTLLCLVLFSIVACEKLVEVHYPTNQIGTVQVFNDIKTANAALNGLYSSLRDKSILNGGSYYGIGPLLDSYSDNLDCYYNSQSVIDIFQNQLMSSNSINENIWKNAYEEIYYANSIIWGADHSTALSNEYKRYIKGEALLIRSLIYFYLQQLYGDIPYTTSLDYEQNRIIKRTDAATVLQNLKADLTEAAGLLQNEYRNSERIYPNRKAAQLLLARVYMLQGSWTLADQMTDSILLSPLYQFQTDINEVFHKSGKHIIWQLKPQKSGDAVAEASFYFFSGSAPKSYAFTTDMVNTFSDDDLRKVSWMSEVSFNGNIWYRPFKYKNTSGSNYNEYNIVLRLEEVYFIKAEVLARQNRFDEAVPYLNATRERAGITALTSISGEDFFLELLTEKRREFFGEFGTRFFDLKRMGELDNLSTLKPNWEDYMQVWPLPQSELLLNPNLLPQNAGY